MGSCVSTRSKSTRHSKKDNSPIFQAAAYQNSDTGNDDHFQVKVEKEIVVTGIPNETFEPQEDADDKPGNSEKDPEKDSVFEEEETDKEDDIQGQSSHEEEEEHKNEEEENRDSEREIDDEKDEGEANEEGMSNEEENEEEVKSESGSAKEDDRDDSEPEDDASSIDSDDKRREYLKDKGIQRDIVMGFINIDVPSQVHLVRIFTSSTFTDTFVERNTLMEKVYPKLKEYCQSVGYDFQVVDMRWGVRDEATDDHMTSELCMRELKACQKLSTGPNFITFLGQKYGYRPFPPRIEAEEFEKMLSVIEDKDEKALLLKWFKKDHNCIPAGYLLCSIRTLLPHYNNQESTPDERQKASDKWWMAFEKMQHALRNAALKVIEDEVKRKKYFISVTEDEITRGILSAKSVKRHCFWFKRDITDLQDNIDKQKARLFIDKTGGGIDKDAVNLLDTLKNDKLLKTLPKDNIKEYCIEWVGEGGVSTKESEMHKKYVEKLCTDFSANLIDMIDEGIKERKLKDLDDVLIREISQHTTTCQEKTRIFHGHYDVLERIHRYIDGDSNRPLIVYGQSGCGKTSLMAKASKDAKERNPKVGLVLRFLGTTSESSTIGKTLHTVCTQLCRINGDDSRSVPNQFKKLYEFFATQLEKMEEKVIIFLDSLDQLSSEDGAHTMQWLPKVLPPNAKLILSTLPGDEYHVFPYLKARIHGEDDVYIQVPKMPESTATDILDAWLKDSGRSLTDYQKKVVLDAFKKTPLPLFLKLSFDEAIRWKSFTPQSDVILEDSIKGAINNLFSRLERLHGKMLISHALGFITASKNGLSDAEIDDLLSIDDEVLNDVYQYWTPPVRRAPPLLWVRARADLGSYIVSRGADGVLVNQWYHRQFIETARERYLQPDVARQLHQTMTEYFLGIWSGQNKKPFTSKSGTSDEKDRLVPAQPNVFSKEGSEEVIFNLRKLNELPRHLIQIKDVERLKRDILFNFDFLVSKLRGTNLRSVLEDFNEAQEEFPDDKDIKLLRDCIQMSARALYNDPFQLAAQLVARLGDYQSNDWVRGLIEDVKESKVPCLYPSVTCFEKPGGPLIHSLAGHTGMVNRACLTRDGSKAASVSQDSTLKLWNMKSGTIIKSIDLASSCDHLEFYCNDSCVVMAGYSGMTAMDLQSEEVVFEDEMITGQYGKTITLSGDQQHLAHAGNEIITVFDIDGKTMVKQRSDEHKAAGNSTGFYDFIIGGGDFFVYTRGDQETIHVRKFNDPNFNKTLEPPKPLINASFTPSGDELAALVSGSAMTEINKEVRLVVWNCKSWDIVMEKISTYDHMVIQAQDISVANLPNGPELIWPAMFQILFWNLNTGTERITLRSGYQGNQYKQAQVGDGRHMLVTSMDFNMHAMQVYDLEALDYDEGGNKTLSDIEKTQAYVGKGEREMSIAQDMSGIGVTVPPSNPYLNVWDIRTHSRIRRVVFDGCFPSAFYCVDSERAMLFDYVSRKVFLVNHQTGKMESVIDGFTGDIAPSAYTNTWEHIGDLKFLLVDRGQKKINIWDMTTGKNVGTIETGWKNKMSGMLVSQDKSTVVINVEDNEYKMKQTPLLIYHMKEKTKVRYEEKEQRLDLRPEVCRITGDGKILVIAGMAADKISIVDTKTAETLRTLTYSGKVQGEKVHGGTVMCLTVAHSAGYIAASVFCSVQVRDEYTNSYRLVVWDISSGELLVWSNAGYYNKMMLSLDDRRLCTISQAVNEQSKAVHLWDMSQVRQGKLKLIGAFLPETDLRFAYISPDGEHVCLGIANIDDVVFLRPCGSERIQREVLDQVPEFKIKTGLKEFDDKKK